MTPIDDRQDTRAAPDTDSDAGRAEPMPRNHAATRAAPDTDTSTGERPRRDLSTARDAGTRQRHNSTARTIDLEQLRSSAFAIAYRMLGTVSDAEDIVQQALMKLHQVMEREDILSPSAYIATVTTRLCIDELRSARVKRETYIGDWLPEPLIVDSDRGGAARVELSESVRMAFLIMLERLTPAQRAVFLLRDVFDYEYADIARIIGKSESAVRQIAVRARARVREDRPRFDVQIERQNALVDRFFAAMEAGDVASLEALLAADVSLHGDGGGKVPALARAIRGRSAVARTLLSWARTRERAGGVIVERAIVNGQPGALIRAVDGAVLGVWAVDVVDGQIAAVRSVVNPDKLRHVPGAGNFGEWLRKAFE